MSARYLLRFDDVCATQRWSVWDGIEAHLKTLQITPIVAVVPDNVDAKLVAEPAIADFWTRVLAWKEQGWTIGLHGYQHRYETTHGGVIGINDYSEFAGLPYRAQEAKLRAGVEILNSHGLPPDVWVAPAHSFDADTVRALRAVGLTAISDGFFPRPGIGNDDMFWLPQQLWKPRWMPAGVWTICVHVNSMNTPAVASLLRFAEVNRREFVSFKGMLNEYGKRRLSKGDYLFAAAYRRVLKVKQKLSKALAH